MSGPRVYGTFLDADGVRHELSGVIDGIFSKKKGEWDSITTCGKYTHDEPDTNPDLYPTCIKCACTHRTISLRVGEPGMIRGQTADVVYYDEVQDMNTNPCAEVPLGPMAVADLINTIGETVKAGATRGRGGTR